MKVRAGAPINGSSAGSLLMLHDFGLDLKGLRRNGEIIDLAVAHGFIEKSGAWFSYNSQRLGQGRENAKNFLRQNPDMANSIEATIRSRSA